MKFLILGRSPGFTLSAGRLPGRYPWALNLRRLGFYGVEGQGPGETGQPFGRSLPRLMTTGYLAGAALTSTKSALRSSVRRADTYRERRISPEEVLTGLSARHLNSRLGSNRHRPGLGGRNHNGAGRIVPMINGVHLATVGALVGAGATPQVRRGEKPSREYPRSLVRGRSTIHRAFSTLFIANFLSSFWGRLSFHRNISISSAWNCRGEQQTKGPAELTRC